MVAPNSSRKKWTIINDRRLQQLKEKFELGRISLKEYMLGASNRVRPNMQIEVEELQDENEVPNNELGEEGADDIGDNLNAPQPQPLEPLGPNNLNYFNEGEYLFVNL